MTNKSVSEVRADVRLKRPRRSAWPRNVGIGRLQDAAALRIVGGLAVLALAACAPLSGPPSSAGLASAGAKTPPARDIMTFALPPDALGAHDPQLTAVLGKAGALAAAQKQPATILVTALGQDFRYINQALWNGVPAPHAANVRLENRTAGPNQPYTVTIKTSDKGSGT
ncbi:hypothetical protein [Pandoraea terrae]